MKDRHIAIETPEGMFEAYLARATDPAAPGIVVMQEIFGINADMRETCERLAAQGFTALCPDLFWRQQRNVELTDQSEAEWRQALALYQAFDLEKGVNDASAALAFLARLDGVPRKIGLVGYCLGGLLTFRTAAHHKVDAAVAYYGGGTDRYLDEARGLASPLLMHLAGDDEYIPPEAQRAIIAALAGKPGVEIHTYAGCQHAFARHHGAHRNPEAAALADGRSLRFFQQHLLGATV